MAGKAAERQDEGKRRQRFTRRLKHRETFAATCHGAFVKVFWKGNRQFVQVAGTNPKMLRG